MTTPVRPRIVLAGNPNVGKTTLFNALTGASAKASNYPGVTVEVRTGQVALDEDIVATVVDLPGTYSLVARSPEEQIAFATLAGIDGSASPDLVVVCVDASQPARSLYLLLQCQELGVRCVVALTMADEAKAATPAPAKLAALLGCAVVQTNAPEKQGITELRTAMRKALATAPPAPQWRWQPSVALQARIDDVLAAVDTANAASTGTHKTVSTWPHTPAVAMWALLCCDEDDELVGVPPAIRAAAMQPVLPQSVDDEPTLARWQWLDREIPALITAVPDRTRTESIDRVLLHRGFGFVVFAAVMTLLFLSLFTFAAPMMDGIEKVVGLGGDQVRNILGPGVLGDFIVDGVIGGVGTVLVFLPQILLLFLFLGLLEDLGYLARVAYLMDRVMRAMNLHGRAFVPMLSGFACAVPAIMATRTLERRRDRLLTMMVIPLMSCSARLPVYTLVITAMMPGKRLTQGLLMVGLYAFSVFAALVAAWVMSKTVKPLKSKRLPFFVELPPYRTPRMRSVLQGMWSRAASFLREAGTVILACSVALWALLYFPRELPNSARNYDALIASAPDDAGKSALETERSTERLRHSYGGRMGQAIEPLIAPLGFDWRIGVGIIGSFAAREVFVATMGITVGVDRSLDEDKQHESLRQTLADAKTPTGNKAYTPLVGMSLLLFFALACQCMSTLAVVKRESQSWRWPLFLLGYMTGLAYVVSLAVYQFGKLLGFG
ncbi:MAG: ferrous iron transport protein B [Kofleriaceae bacterium]|nr:ferrous iron transport protein B [Kofleriaceae bacterium]